jgi:hypothetical protein
MSMKIRRNLGSVIGEVRDNGVKGYKVFFEDGDICNADSYTKFSSEINYVCNMDSDEAGWPVM